MAKKYQSATKHEIPVKFHFFSLTFTPYKDDSSSVDSVTIFKNIATYISKQKQAGKGHLINRNEGSELKPPRELFMTSAVVQHR
jgi:hypothetical protein